jgi:hypothetical protein
MIVTPEGVKSRKRFQLKKVKYKGAHDSVIGPDSYNLENCVKDKHEKNYSFLVPAIIFVRICTMVVIVRMS